MIKVAVAGATGRMGKLAVELINGAQDLTIRNTSGGTIFGGSIGDTTPLKSLTASGDLLFTGDQVVTSGAQLFNGVVTLGGTVGGTTTRSEEHTSELQSH